MKTSLQHQVDAIVGCHLQPDEKVWLSAYALNDADTPWWRIALRIILVILLLPIHIAVGGLPWGDAQSGYAVALTDRRLLLVPARFSSGLIVTKFSPAKGEPVAWTVDQVASMRIDVKNDPAADELKLALTRSEGGAVKLLFMPNPTLSDNLGQAREIAGRLRRTV